MHAKIPAQVPEAGGDLRRLPRQQDHGAEAHSPGGPWIKALKDIGKTQAKVTRQEKRSLVCAQCHVTYVIPKDKEMKSVGVFFPWQGSKLGDISVENIIKVIKSDPAYLEWKQNVTGFKVGFIRHPEYEFYTRNSVHWKAKVACADCHMPYIRVGANKISNHDVMSPLKTT